MSAVKIGELKREDFKTIQLESSVMGEISLDAVKNRILYIDRHLDAFGQPPGEAEYLLVVVNGKPRSWFAMEASGPFDIGREDSSDIVVDDPTASRRHCRIRKDGGNWLIEDKKSQNGTFVNGRKTSERILCEGDIIRIGTVEMIYINNRKPEFV